MYGTHFRPGCGSESPLFDSPLLKVLRLSFVAREGESVTLPSVVICFMGGMFYNLSTMFFDIFLDIFLHVLRSMHNRFEPVMASPGFQLDDITFINSGILGISA